MFGHLNAEEFLNLIDGLDVGIARRAHLDECVKCQAMWKSMESAHADFLSMDHQMPEPDWNEFRASVRNELLSRSVQRASAVRRWTGWPIRPAMAWGLSMVMAVAITTGAFLWHMDSTTTDSASESGTASVAAIDASLEAGTIETEMSVWSGPGVFEELAQLGTVEEESLREMLQSAEQESLDGK